MLKTTYGNLKKRILDILFEYSHSSDEVFIADGDRELICERMPDAVNTALIRIYESLPTGIASGVRRLFSKEKIAYAERIGNSGTSVFADGGSFAVYFRYFGSGTLFLCSEDGKERVELYCDGDDGLCEKREIITLEKGGKYEVVTSDGFEAYGFSLYKGEHFLECGGIPSGNEASFELPSDLQRLLYVKTKYGKVDGDLVRVCGNYAFLSKDVCRQDEGVLCVYRKKPPFTDGDTSDEFEFALSPLEFESLVCLAAAELCRSEDTAAYTRLVCKYSDYEQALIAEGRKINRNGFYMPHKRRGL